MNSFKHILIMLTILTVSIWFKPVTSDLTFEQHRDLCVGLIIKFTQYNNDTNDFQMCYNNAPSLEKIVDHINRCQELIEHYNSNINWCQGMNKYWQEEEKKNLKNHVNRSQKHVNQTQEEVKNYHYHAQQIKYYQDRIKYLQEVVNQNDYYKYFNTWMPQLGANSEFYDKSKKKALIIVELREKYTTFLIELKNKPEKSVVLNPATSFCAANIKSRNSTYLKDLINGQGVIDDESS